MRTCRLCGQNNPLPNKFESNHHWIWESKKDRKSGGVHYCRNCRTNKKKVAWNAFYDRKQLRCAVSRSINQKLKRKGGSKSGSILEALPYSIEELKIHLESKFQPGMTWENYGEWHIDHVVPLAKFDLLNREELLKACNYTNLQPLWAIDNIKKRDK